MVEVNLFSFISAVRLHLPCKQGITGKMTKKSNSDKELEGSSHSLPIEDFTLFLCNRLTCFALSFSEKSHAVTFETFSSLEL